MEIAIQLIIGLVAFIHLYILWFEMFAWESRGPRVFKNFPKDLFPPTKAMAANQGLYNGFLAAGLIWTFFICDIAWRDNVALFFLACVAIAGLYGTFTADKKILFVQTVPAMIGILLVLLR
jgi:putative membrane protein